jgi:hypothetical protein
MSELSEVAYHAGWMKGLEFSLWQVALGERREYGHAIFTAEHPDHLRCLSERCGGWIIFDDVREEAWISDVDWKRRFSEWQNNPARRRADG